MLVNASADNTLFRQATQLIARWLLCVTVSPEIQGTIKGCEGSLTTHRGRLSRQQYVQLAGRRCSNLAEEQRVAVYKIFLR